MNLADTTSGKLVMWITNENVYRPDLFKNGTMDFEIIENQSLFCIGHDGESLLILTNDKNFQNHDTLIKTFPSNTTFSIED
ncbi:hypothetical protein [Sporosarcina sp. P7]|uniref:hypothetical protein n=1 Tax=Sporosarcina sp. P7 TaxID=2048244 RepID=UPI00117D3485|nr:hypothetical protein [Sporosarcina sp. P7]